MPILINERKFLTPGDVQKEFGISDTKLRRLAQLGIIPSLPTGTRGKNGGPELRIYDEQVLYSLDPTIWKPLTRGVKTTGDDRYYSRRRSQTNM